MIRIFGRALVSRTTTVLIDLVVILLMGASLYELLREFVRERTEAREIIVNVSVIMIGWGVALEERGSVRDIFGVRGDADDAWQDRIDHACHGVGVVLLLAGLFAEIFEQLVSLPKSVMSMEPVRDVLLAIATLFVIGGLVVLIVHVAQLVLMKPPGAVRSATQDKA